MRRMVWVGALWMLGLGCAAAPEQSAKRWETWVATASESSVNANQSAVSTSPLRGRNVGTLEVLRHVAERRVVGGGDGFERRLREAYAQSDGWNLELRLGDPSTRVLDDTRRLDVRAAVRWKPEKPGMDEVRKAQGTAHVSELRARSWERGMRAADAVGLWLLQAWGEGRRAALLERRLERCMDVSKRLDALAVEGLGNSGVQATQERVRCARLRRSLERARRKHTHAEGQVRWWVADAQLEVSAMEGAQGFGTDGVGSLGLERALEVDVELRALRGRFEGVHARKMREDTRSKLWVSFVEVSARGRSETGDDADEAWVQGAVAFDFGLGGHEGDIARLELELLREDVKRRVHAVRRELDGLREEERALRAAWSDDQRRFEEEQKRVRSLRAEGKRRGGLDVGQEWALERALWGLEDDLLESWWAWQEAALRYTLRSGVWWEARRG